MLRGASSSRLAIYHHVVRRRVTPVFPPAPEDPFCARVDAGWRNRLAGRQLYVNDIFLTLVRRPLQGGAGFLERLVRQPGAKKVELERELRQLHAARDAFAAVLAPYGPRTLSLYEGPGGALRSEPAEFLSLILNGELRPVLAPSGNLGEAISARRLSFGLDAMEFGPGPGPAQFGRHDLAEGTIRRARRPACWTASCGFPWRWCSPRASPSWTARPRSTAWACALRRLKAADDDAYSLRSELAQARDDVGAGRAAYGEHHLTILAKAGSLDELDAGVADVQSALAEAGAIAVREDTNLEPAFWAQFPGNFKYVARKALISAGNFSSLASFHNHPTGQANGGHWGPAIAVLETTSFGPYPFQFPQRRPRQLHDHRPVGFRQDGAADLPAGPGRTAEAADRLFRQGPRGPNPSSARSAGVTMSFRRASPRASIRSPWPTIRPTAPSLADWLGQLLTADGAALDSEDRAMIADAVDANYAQPVGHRRLRYLRELFRGGPPAQRRRPRLAAGRLVRRRRAPPGCSTMPTTASTSTPASSAST